MKKSKHIRIVIDTNLWISFIISKKHHLLDPYLYSSQIRLLFSEELVDEINNTIQKPKLRKYFANNALDEMLLAFEPFIDFIKVKSRIQICRDAKDDFLLALAKDGNADYLITGDSDLLVIRKFEDTEILKITEFLKLSKLLRNETRTPQR